jgi:hypothetical protein
MIIDKQPTKSEYKKLKDLKKKWRLVNNYFNIQNQLIVGKSIYLIIQSNPKL